MDGGAVERAPPPPLPWQYGFVCHPRPLTIRENPKPRNRKPAPFQSSTRHSKQTLSVLLAAAKARKLGRRHHPVLSLHVLPLYSQRPLPSVHHLYVYMYISKHACMHARAQYSHIVITGSVLTKAKVSFVHLIGVARHLFAGAARAASGVLTALALPALLLAVSPESPRGLASVHSRV